MKRWIGLDDPALIGAGQPIVSRFAARPLEFVDHTKREANLMRSLERFSKHGPPLFREIRCLQSAPVMGVGSVDAMIHHLLHLAPQFFTFEFAVPEPERADAVSPLWILKLPVERGEAVGENGCTLYLRPGRPECKSTDAHAAKTKKVSASDSAHVLSFV